MPPDQFGVYVAWLRDKYYFFQVVGPTDEVGPSATIDDDFNTEVDELLIRDD